MSSEKKKAIILDSHPKAESKRLQFSFKHLDEHHPKFKLDACSQEYFQSLLIQIKNYSEYTEEQFREQNNKDGRHFSIWSDTTEPDGFTQLSEEMQDDGFWQFALCPQRYTSPDDKWRVHGMLIDNIFFVVWLDPEHKLAPRDSRHAS